MKLNKLMKTFLMSNKIKTFGHTQYNSIVKPSDRLSVLSSGYQGIRPRRGANQLIG